MSKKYFVTAIGNAIIDVLAFVEEEFLERHYLKKSSMTLIDKHHAMDLVSLKYEKISSGGSTANTVVALSAMGSSTAFIGNVGSGNYGDLFQEDMTENNVDFYCKFKTEFGSTARSFVLITPDKERTMCTFLGEASNISNAIDADAIANSEILFVEGYLWDKEITIKDLKRAMLIAKENQTKIAFTLSDVSFVTRHRQDFLKLSSKIDILFANEEEIKTLIGSDDLSKIKVLTNHNEHLIVVVTRSGNSALVLDGTTQEIHEIPAITTDNIVDATGAGDAFAAGFLHGVEKELSLEKSAQVGHFFASKMIQKVGGRFDKEEITQIKEYLASLSI